MLGFRPLPGGSRVFMKVLGEGSFRVHEAGPDTIIVELPNTTTTSRLNLRPMDTHFFNSAVTLVTPSNYGGDYRVEIKLKQRVPYTSGQKKGMVYVDFLPPASSIVGD